MSHPPRLAGPGDQRATAEHHGRGDPDHHPDDRDRRPVVPSSASRLTLVHPPEVRQAAASGDEKLLDFLADAEGRVNEAPCGGAGHGTRLPPRDPLGSRGRSTPTRCRPRRASRTGWPPRGTSRPCMAGGRWSRGTRRARPSSTPGWWAWRCPTGRCARRFRRRRRPIRPRSAGACRSRRRTRPPGSSRHRWLAAHEGRAAIAGVARGNATTTGANTGGGGAAGAHAWADAVMSTRAERRSMTTQR